MRSVRSRAAVSRCSFMSPATRAMTSRNMTLEAVAIIGASVTPWFRSSISSTAGAISAATDMRARRRPPVWLCGCRSLIVRRRIDGCRAQSAVAV